MGWMRTIGCSGLVVTVGACVGCGPSHGGSADADEDVPASTDESGEHEESGDPEASSTEGDGSTTAGETGIEPPLGECSTVPGDHAASCTDADACPIVVDVEIVCNEDQFGTSGVRVAADDDSTLLVAGGDGSARVFEADDDGDVTTTPLPDAFARTAVHLGQAADGSVRLLADTTWNSAPGESAGVVMLSPDRAGWSTQEVWSSADDHTQIVDFALVDDVPHAWFPTPDVLSHAVRGDDGTWDLGVVDLVAGGGGWTRVSLVDGSSVAHDLVETGTDTRALVSRVEGQDVVWESTDVQRSFAQIRMPPSSGAGLPADPTTWIAALASDAGVRVAWGPGAGTALDLLDTAVPELPCGAALEPPNCDVECDYQATGLANPAEGFAIARTDDGTVWVAIAVAHYDQHWTYSESCPDEDSDCYCYGELDQDASSGETRLYRVAADGTSSALVLTVPTGVPDEGSLYEQGYAVDLRAWGDDLALGVQALVDPTQSLGPGAHRVRVLRIDTALLP